VDHTCDRCGRLVCDRHWDEDIGMCVECGAEVGQPSDRVPSEDMPDGVDTYRF
jgi:ribosomal protein L37AE/L43A